MIGWLDAVLATPLPPLGGAALGEVTTLLPEMEFWMPSRQLDSAAFAQVCALLNQIIALA